MTVEKIQTINVETLLNGIVAWPSEYTIEINGLSSDSRKTKPGDLFLACAGPTLEHTRFIKQAIDKGATAVLRNAENDAIDTVTHKAGGYTVPIMSVPKLNEKIGTIAARFYENPSQQLKMIGVTGTNGKTSCSQFIAHALTQAGTSCGVIGTLGHGFPNKLTPGTLTTPDPITLQNILANLKQQGANSIAMEVSSHALVQQRVSAVNFDIAIFTNLTRDHLDYHGDMFHYAKAKRLLFLHPHLKYAVINADDKFGNQLLKEFSSQLTCYAYSTQNAQNYENEISATQIKLHSHGISAHITSPWGEGILKSKLLGRFNLSNLLATLTTLNILGTSFETALEQIATLSTLPGRMQTFGGGKLPLVIVDYAHTPDALEKALTALREHCSGKLWCVFGCGGNRDAGKRELMGQIAERFSDQLIITDDNPRFEDPNHITDEIMKGLLCPWAAEVEHNRRAAITHTIDCAQTGDVILIAGKGHEQYQQIGNEKIPFSDAEHVKLQLTAKEIS